MESHCLLQRSLMPELQGFASLHVTGGYGERQAAPVTKCRSARPVAVMRFSASRLSRVRAAVLVLVRVQLAGRGTAGRADAQGQRKWYRSA